MNRIKEIRIIEAAAGRPPYVVFRDELDVRDGWYGQSYRPSYRALEIIRRLGHCMDVDMDFRAGVTTLRRREAQADASPQEKRDGAIYRTDQKLPSGV